MYRYGVTNSYWKCKQKMVLRGRNTRTARREYLKERKRKKERDVSFIYSHASVPLVKEGEDTRPLSPNLLPVSPCFSIDFPDKVQNHLSTLLHRLPLPSVSVSLFISFSLSLFLSCIYALTTSLSSLMFEKGA